MKLPLRQICLERRAALTPDAHEALSFAVCERLVGFLSGISLKERCVALYNPVRSELDVTPVLHALYAEGVSVALPVVESGSQELAFFRFHSTLNMTQGAFGIPEPEQFERVQPHIVIVPLLAFDRALHRLGYGKGYYDVTLERLRTRTPALLAIGVGFALQEEASLPAEAHDAKLDAIITENEIISGPVGI